MTLSFVVYDPFTHVVHDSFFFDMRQVAIIQVRFIQIRQ